MQVSFIIPLYNCLALTKAMLASLRETLPKGLTHEIIFVDDGSTDGTRSWLATLGDNYVTVINEKNLGFAGSCNRGAGIARGEFIFFLNNDLILLPKWLEPMLAAFARYLDAGFIGNVQLNAGSGSIDHSGIFFNHKGKPAHDIRRPLVARLTGYRRVPALTGACFGVRTKVWRALGGFDEGFINGAEDVDLCLRAEAAGFSNYVALHSVVRHHISQSAGRKLRDEQNSQRLMLRWKDTIAEKIIRAWCWHHLETYWTDPRDFPNATLARQAFYHVIYLRSKPPELSKLGAHQAINLELERWKKLFENPLS